MIPTTVAEVDTVALDDLPALVAVYAALMARAAARLAETRTPEGNGADGEDRLVEVAEAARKLGTTPTWLRKNAERLGLALRPGPGQLRFSIRALDDWIAEHRRLATEP